MFEIWDKFTESWFGISFSYFTAAEDFVEKELKSAWDRYVIYERIT